jgi:hypothetical protein
MTHKKTYAPQVSIANLSLKAPNAEQITMKVILNIKANPRYLALFCIHNASMTADRTSYFIVN